MTVRLFGLAKAADKLAQGDLSTRLDVRGNDEIALLIRSFNAMARDLQEVDIQKRQLEKTRRDLVAWVSHDLRTPLTSMRVMMEALADGVITDDETQSRYIKTTLNEIEHLSRLIQDLFEMARLDVGHLELDYAQTPIADLISDTIGGLMPKAQRKNILLTGHVEDDIDLVQVAPDKIQRVLKNLIDNAIQYSPTGERVVVTAYRKDNDCIQVDIHNTGVHIAKDVLPNLFDSFYRGEQSRANTDNERGTGLGLAIARGFIQAHGGEIWVESLPQSGTTFSFTVPERQHQDT
ncbi:MAG: ATP-binding protein [Anaerolineae bacterium]|nr:ATP-binding protein [Anaerolineae bacterium]